MNMQNAHSVVVALVLSQRIRRRAVHDGSVENVVTASTVVVDQSDSGRIDFNDGFADIRVIGAASFVCGKFIDAFVINDDAFHASCYIDVVAHRIQGLEVRLGEVDVEVDSCRVNLVGAFFAADDNGKGRKENYFFQGGVGGVGLRNWDGMPVFGT